MLKSEPRGDPEIRPLDSPLKEGVSEKSSGPVQTASK